MTFDQAIEIVLAKEGGFQADPDDTGNWTSGKKGVGVLKGTKYGISAASYPDLDIRNLTRGQAVEIYRRDFWPSIKPDWLPAALRLSVFDVAVNSGPRRAIVFLQQVAGIKADGVFGPVTRDMLHKVNVVNYNVRRLEFVMDSAVNQRFKKGIALRILRISHM